MKHRYPLIIFDWDGTLIDSQAHIIDSMRGAIADQGLEVPADDAIRHIIGLSLPVAIATLLPRIDDSRVQRIADGYRRHFFRDSQRMGQMFEGVEDLVRDLHGRGHFLAVATGKGRRGLDMALQQTGLGKYFHITRCADETRSKPHPQMLEEILVDLDMSPRDAVMVGDTQYDLEMARNIGMDSLAVTYGMHDRELLQKSEPTYIIDDLAELQKIV
jgi:phosphoglycolate phosphatase